MWFFPKQAPVFLLASVEKKCVSLELALGHAMHISARVIYTTLVASVTSQWWSWHMCLTLKVISKLDFGRILCLLCT